MAWVEVFDASTSESMWIVSGQGINAIFPVVRYGLAPAGTVELVGPEALASGETYEVRVLRWVDANGGPGGLFGGGSATFVP